MTVKSKQRMREQKKTLEKKYGSYEADERAGSNLATQ